MGRFIDLTGQKFGRLTVKGEKDISEYKAGKRPCVQWYCDCDCGTKNVVVDGTSLRRGHSTSCGCYNKHISKTKNSIDITGNKYGKLTVLRRAERPNYVSSNRRGAWWECECECGNIVVIRGNALKTGGTQSCGCLTSKAELLIREILVENNVKFKTQYMFDDCKSEISNYFLKYDFAIFDNENNIKCLIEYDGEQHYNGSRFAPTKEKNEEKFRRTVMYDKVKNDYCKSHGIKLVRIPYWEFNNIETIIKNILEEKE